MATAKSTKLAKKVRYNGSVYIVLQKHTSQENWNPADAAAIFTEVLIPDDNVIPEWKQPGSTNPYNKGDTVRFNGKTYTSIINSNVWSPTAFPEGWQEVSS